MVLRPAEAVATVDTLTKQPRAGEVYDSACSGTRRCPLVRRGSCTWMVHDGGCTTATPTPGTVYVELQLHWPTSLMGICSSLADAACISRPETAVTTLYELVLDDVQPAATCKLASVQCANQSSKLCFLNTRNSWTLAMPLVHSQIVCSCNAHPVACCESGTLQSCPFMYRCLWSQKAVSPTRRNGNSLNFLQQFGIITVVLVHSVFQAVPT